MNTRLFLSLAVMLCLVHFPLAQAQEKKQEEKSVTASNEEEKKDDAPSSPEETYKQLNLFGDVFERVRAQYVDKVSDEKLIEYAINGMLTSLDAHSSYLNMKDFDDMRTQTRGEFGGLGIEVTMEEGLVKVVSPIDDTPAFKAGVKSGDFIVQIDDKPIIGMTLSDAVEKMRGKVGSPVKLTIRRKDVAEPIEVKIVRDVIKIQSVRSRVEGGNIGYLRITTFNQNTFIGLKDAIAKIEKESGTKLMGYVIDLRNNPGGLLDQAISVSDVFLDKGEIVSTRGRDANDIKRDYATSGDLTKGLPLVVLINGGSASAAEIVSGALQDHRRAIVMGTRSFGKGSVQTVIPMAGDGAMRLTTARYYTPSGRSIQAKGIDPDIIVEPAKLEKIDDKSFHEEDLKGALANPDSAKPKENESESPDPAAPANDNAESKDGTSDEKPNLSKEAEQDYQLQRAMDLLRGLALYQDKGK